MSHPVEKKKLITGAKVLISLGKKMGKSWLQLKKNQLSEYVILQFIFTVIATVPSKPMASYG